MVGKAFILGLGFAIFMASLPSMGQAAAVVPVKSTADLAAVKLNVDLAAAKSTDLAAAKSAVDSSTAAKLTVNALPNSPSGIVATGFVNPPQPPGINPTNNLPALPPPPKSGSIDPRIQTVGTANLGNNVLAATANTDSNSQPKNALSGPLLTNNGQAAAITGSVNPPPLPTKTDATDRNQVVGTTNLGNNVLAATAITDSNGQSKTAASGTNPINNSQAASAIAGSVNPPPKQAVIGNPTNSGPSAAINKDQAATGTNLGNNLQALPPKKDCIDQASGSSLTNIGQASPSTNPDSTSNQQKSAVVPKLSAINVPPVTTSQGLGR